MKYEFKLTWGLLLHHGSEPFQKVVNNGCVIETQDENLIRQLINDENNRKSKPIDWWLFKVGETILSCDDENYFACTMNNSGKWIQLIKIIEQ